MEKSKNKLTKMETLEVKQGIKLVLQNYYHPQYPEDDWKITMIGDTVEELTNTFWKERYVESGIHVTGIKFSKIKYVEYGSRKIEIERTDYDEDLHKLFRSQFLNDDLIKPAEEERKRLLVEKKKQEDREYEQQKRASELAKLRELKDKYPNEN